jgi:ribosomal protein S18 acetylase RimI-like enzyme
MLADYAIAPAVSAERNFIADSWRRSLQDQPAYASMPTRGYVAFANAVIGHFIGPGGQLVLDPRDRLYIARDRERPAYCYGWLLGRDLSPGHALVYLYVKSAHRRQGIARDLLLNAIEATEDGPLTYAFRTRADAWFDALGMQFVPVETLEYGERQAS